MTASERPRGTTPTASRRAATSTQHSECPTDDLEPVLFGVDVSVHPDHGTRIAWTVPTPDELREQCLAQVEHRASSWEREQIDRVIAEAVARARRSGGTLSANDVRPRLPQGVHRPLIGSRFLAAARRGDLVHAGYVRSTDPRTRGAVVALWRPA